MKTDYSEDFIDLDGIAKGDTEALLYVYKLYRNKVYGFAYRMLGIQSTAEDITHEAFLMLIEHPEKYQAERSSILTFLCIVARSRILNKFRRQIYEVEESTNDEDLNLIKDSSQSSPLSALLEQELENKVNESIALLPPLQREVIILRKFQELSYYEISMVTGVEVNVVKARLHRARQTLAKNLAPYLKTKGDECHELRRS